MNTWTIVGILAGGISGFIAGFLVAAYALGCD